MATGWIKYRTKLYTDGRVRKVARGLKVLPITVIGGLMVLWSIADEHADSEGFLPDYSVEDLDSLIGIVGFSNSLPSDWMIVKEDGILLPNYVNHNGQTAKTRLENAARVVKHRNKKNPKNDGENGGETKKGKPETAPDVTQERYKSVTPVTEERYTCNKTPLTREEKRRINTSLRPSAILSKSPEQSSGYLSFERLWNLYPKKTYRDFAQKVFKNLPLTIELSEEILEGLQRWKNSGLWDDANYVPALNIWLHEKRWKQIPGNARSNPKPDSRTDAMDQKRLAVLNSIARLGEES